MRRSFALAALCVVVVVVAPMQLKAQDPPGCYPRAWLDDAEYLICVPPTNFNGMFVVYAHGYTDPRLLPGISPDQLALPDGGSLPELVMSLGFGFAMTSYSKNGLAVVDGIGDVKALVSELKQRVPGLDGIFLVGASEGSLIATKLMEEPHTPFAAALALCGPCGDFKDQLNHIGDFRAVFDYFFPNLLPGSPVSIPQEQMALWESHHLPAVLAAIRSRPLATLQVLSVMKIFTGFDATNTGEAFENLLRYNVVGTNDAVNELKGSPFDNTTRRYTGSFNDWALNRFVKRYAAADGALKEIEKNYQTTGNLGGPLVNMHTTFDPLVPYSQAQRYGAKVISQGKSALYTHIPILRFGHCRFTTNELLFGFYLMVLKGSVR